MTWQDPRRCCRGVGMPASCRRTEGQQLSAKAHPGTWPLTLPNWGPQIGPGVSAPLHPGQIISGGQEGTGTCPGLVPVAANHDLPESSMGHRGTQVRSRAVPGPSVLGSGNEPPAGLQRMMELKGESRFLAPQVPDVYLGGTDPDETPSFQLCVQPFFHLWAVSLPHSTKSYIP